MSEPPESFEAAQANLFRLHDLGRHREALAEALAARDRFPERDGKTTYWAACLLGILGRADEALAELRGGLDRGLWWSTVALADRDLDGVRRRPEFDAIARECARRWRAAQEVARLDLVVRRPSGGGGGGPESPLLLALHWRGGSARDFVRHWASAPRHGALLAVPQSSQVFGIGEFGWDNLDRTRDDLAETLRLLAASETFDPGSVVLAGASQGAARAVQLALAGKPFASRGFIAVVPAFGGRATPSLAELVPLIERARERRVRGWMVLGADDQPRAQAEEVAAEMRRRGLDLEVTVVPGLDHDFPPDFDARLPGALDFVIGRPA